MSGSKSTEAAIISVLPAIVSPVIEAIAKAVEEGRMNAVRAELATALEQARLYELAAAVNSRKAQEYYEKSEQQDALIKKQDELIRAQSETINDLRSKK